MRIRTVLVLGLLLTAGCGPGEQETPGVASVQGATPTAAAPVSASVDPGAPLKHARCMREHGMTWFPDPPGAGLPMEIRIPDTVKKEDFDAAMEACRKFAPSGTDKGGPNAADVEKMRQMSQCMRENGVPDFPDPKADGRMELDDSLSVKPGDPVFDKAEEACSQYQPSGGSKRVGGGPAVVGN